MSSSTLIFTLSLATISYGQIIGSDGFPNKPCLRLTDFSIDGDWWAKSETEIDWSSVLEGTRDTSTNQEWRSTQNQCTKSGLRWGYFYKAGIFCDTFDITEQSHLQTGTKHALDANPDVWVPLISTSMQDKGDLTNAYYVGSDMDLIICAAFERIDVNGAAYMDIEFNQDVEWNFTDPVECNATKGEDWKCLYPKRKAKDIQVSFVIANDITKNLVIIYEWNPATNEYDILRQEDMSTATDPYYYKSPDGAFEAAVSEAPMNASSFGYICDDKNPLTADCPQIPYAGAFFESCIDFKKVGITSLHFESLVIKARASANGAYKDTSGVLWHLIDGPKINRYHLNECNISLTDYPTLSPTTPTQPPTTFAPTATTIGPTSFPSTSPTDATSAPSTSPTEVTSAPTTREPTPRPTDTPTQATPTSSPTEVTSGPTGVPTKTPTMDPTADPTADPTDDPTADPTKTPTMDPTGYPTKRPTIGNGQPRPSSKGNNPDLGQQFADAFSGDSGDCEDGWIACNSTVFVILVAAGVGFVAYWALGAWWYKARQLKRADPSFVSQDSVEMGNGNGVDTRPTSNSGWKSAWELEQEAKAAGQVR